MNGQKFSLFHSTEYNKLKTWHSPYLKPFLMAHKVIDIGCGTGAFLDLMKENNIQAIGVDVDQNVVEQTIQRGHIAHVASDKELNPIIKGADGIHISHVIEHLDGDRMIELLTRCYRNLKDGGVLVVRTPNWSNHHVSSGGFWDDHTHIRPYSLRLLDRIFHDLGFTVTSKGHEPFGWEDTYIIGRKNPTSAVSEDTIIWPKTKLSSPASQTRRLKSRIKNWLLN